MITTTGRSRAAVGGFTLTELMVVMTLTVILAGAMFAAFGFVMRGSFAMANYGAMTAEGRRGLEIFARDARTAVDVSDFSNISVTLHLESEGGGSDEVIYRYVPARRTFEREQDGEVRPLMNDVRRFHFRRFNLHGQQTDKDLETVQIQLELSMVKHVLARETSEKVVSARFVMRNKQVTR